jgi:hypothetical protein
LSLKKHAVSSVSVKIEAGLFDVARWVLKTGSDDFTVGREVDELVLKKFGAHVQQVDRWLMRAPLAYHLPSQWSRQGKWVADDMKSL